MVKEVEMAALHTSKMITLTGKEKISFERKCWMIIFYVLTLKSFYKKVERIIQHGGIKHLNILISSSF